jgi:hypothetical protein
LDFGFRKPLEPYAEGIVYFARLSKRIFLS